MDKEQETLDMVLDIPNTISLNPFDRPPNIMDDDLNSVTQEELEANLSTDCPTRGATEIIETNTHHNANDMWEQLIQSVLEDTSTQDAVQEQDDCEIKLAILQNAEKEELNEHAHTEVVKDEKNTEEIIKNDIKTDTDAMDWDKEEEFINIDIKADDSVQSKEENHTDKTDNTDSSYIKKENVILDYSLGEEQILSQHVTDNYYMDDLNNDDAQDDICQVEVYASNQEDLNDNNHFRDNISENEDELLEDNMSEVSAISLGRLEKIDYEHEDDCKPQTDKESHLSTIISDHCYSQEINLKVHESDVLKQNVIQHLIAQNQNKDDHKKITKLVDRIFNNLDNEKLNKILDSLSLNETRVTSTANPELNINRIEENLENVAENLDKTTDCLENIDKLQDKEISGKELSRTETLMDENPPEAIETVKKIEDENQQNYPQNEQQEIELENVINSHKNINKPECNTNHILNEEEIISSKSSSNKNDSYSQTTLISESETMDTKSIVESLMDNCSEPIEHNLFEEEFEELCQKGVLPIAKVKTKTDLSLQLLEKLKDFVSHIQKDYLAFTKASTNIDEKLHNYIKQQYLQYQELFKPYCYSSNKQTVETQTDLKRLTKRKCRTPNKDSKNQIKNSGHSQIYSSTSEDEEEDEILNSNKDTKINNPITDQTKDGLDESKTLLSETKSISLPPCTTNPFITNHSQEYDDGINLSQYVQSEIFDVDSTSQQSLIPSDDSDSLKDDDDDDDDIPAKDSHQNSSFEEDKDEESDDTILFKIRPKKSKKLDSDSNKTRKSQSGGTDNISVNSESDKENLTSDRKDKKSNDSLDEDEKNDKEIERLTNISGLAKRSVCNGSSTKNSDKNKPKAAASKNLNDGFDFMDVEFGSDDEVKSDAEEEIITEKQFLERCNEDIKRQMLNDSSTDSDEIDEDDDDLLKASSEEDDEGGNKSPLVEKFLKTYVVDDSDNDIDDDNDDDEDPEIESDKDEDASASNKEAKTSDDVVALDDKDKAVDLLDDGEDSPSAAELELLDANFRYRNRSTKNQKLEKMLSDVEKRKNISKIDAELISLSSDTENSDNEAIDVEPNQSTKPRALKPMLRNDQLAGETIKAQKNENERISRLEKKQNLLQKVLKEHPDLDKNKELILDYIKETKTFIKVHPGIVKHLKPHQFDGVRFMYDSCYGGVDALKKSPGSGCILAHCMGLGKTLQLIALLHTVISYKELKTTKILVLCPKSTVMNWADEIIRWLGPLRQKNVKVYTFSDTSDINEKLSILREWSLSSNTRAGCLLIGYEAFRTLVFYHSYKNRGNINSQRLEEIRKNIDSYLLQPGADLVVCDEGHIIKNSKSAISMAVAKIVTPRRIVLTGTPIQNNLKEYYSMVNFIKPLFLGTEKEFANLYANPIKNGQHKDSGKTDIKIMKQRSFVLHKKLSKFVQRKEAELLKTFLPTKFEYVLFIPMTDVQNNLYQYILNAIANRDENYRGKGLITDYTCLRKIWTHPKVLEDAWKNAINQRNKKEQKNNKLLSHNSDDDQPDDIYDSQTGQMSVTNDWWRHLVNEKDLESVMPSNKLRTMLKILQMCEEQNEKCLIFSAFVAVLNVVEYFFKKINEGDPTLLSELNINNNSKWILGQDYYRLDGKTQKSIRHAMINEFNNIRNKRARVFLISAKAGGQGINLIGANRVIILDTSWNPSNDQQNIFRVFRLGQTRCCYIYRLLAMGTMEEKVYSRSVTKQAMSFRVVDEQQIDRHYNMAELAELYALTIPDHSNRPTPIRPQDNILARLLRSFPDLVFKYHEHDSLLENKVEQELSEQEKNEAWTAYERDLQMSSEIREMPNMEDLQNKFNANLPNYMSPFSGLDVSNSNNQNPNSSKNMSPLFNYRGFGQPFLQSLLGQNNPAATQQYIEMFNYYKSLGNSYADLNAYSQLPGIGGGVGGRMPTSSSASTVPTNPLTALGDLSMYGLSSSALQSLGASAAALNLPSSLSSSSAALQQLTNSASMYTSSPSSMQTNLPTTSASSLAAGGLTSASNSAATLSAFEQYTQSLRGSFPNMYNYTGDFGLSSSGSTILDKSKGKNSKQGNSNNKNTNLPGGSKGGSALGLYPGPPAYLPQQQQQQQQQQQSMPNSRSTPSTAEQSHKGRPSTTSSTSSSASSNNSMMSANSGRFPNSNDLINYRRSDSAGAGSNSASTTQQKKSDGDNNNNPKQNFTPNPKSMKSAANVSTPPALPANQKLNQKSSLNLSSNASSSGSNKTSLQAEARSLNMGILYPNSKGLDKSSNKPNSPLNMGIVYPKSSNKSSSEMQIIPTSSPPGTTSISKQLNDLPPSISLTALKNNTPNNQQQQNITSKTNTTTAQNMQINKVIQSNNTTVRRTSPVQSTSGSKISANLNSTNGNTTSSQNSILARYKTLNNNNNKKPPPSNSNNPMPPLHRSSTIASISNSNTTPKTPAGLTITNIKTPMKSQNITTAKQIAASQQATTLAKQTAAAAVAKSNVQRLSTPNTSNSSANSLQKPSANQIQTTTTLPSLTSIKRVISRASPNKLPPSLSSPSSSLTVTSSTKVPIISSVKSISQSPSNMATITKASISKTNPANNTMILTKSTTSASGQNLPSVTNVSKALAQMQKNLPASATSSTTPSNIVNAARSTVNIRPVDNKQNPAGSGGVYIIETNINDKKLAIGAPTKSGGGTTVTKVPIQTAIKRKATDSVSKDISAESKRLKK